MTLQERQVLGINEENFQQNLSFRKSFREPARQENMTKEYPHGVWDVVISHQEPYESSYDNSVGTFDSYEEAALLCDKFDEAYAIGELAMGESVDPHFMWASIQYKHPAMPIANIYPVFTVSTRRTGTKDNRVIDSIDVFFYTDTQLQKSMVEDKSLTSLVANPEKAFLNDYRYNELNGMTLSSDAFLSLEDFPVSEEEILLREIFKENQVLEIVENFITFNPNNIILINPKNVKVDYLSAMKQFVRR